jgi:hypothetical protein
MQEKQDRGRPRNRERKLPVQLRLTFDEKENLREIAEKEGRTLAGHLRWLAVRMLPQKAEKSVRD